MELNGKHEVRLERIEQSLQDLHDKVDDIVETGVVNKADIVWLKWTSRLLLAAVMGLGGATLGGVV